MDTYEEYQAFFAEQAKAACMKYLKIKTPSDSLLDEKDHEVITSYWMRSISKRELYEYALEKGRREDEWESFIGSLSNPDTGEVRDHTSNDEQSEEQIGS